MTSKPRLESALAFVRRALLVAILLAPPILLVSGWRMDPEPRLCNPDDEHVPVQKTVKDPVTLNLRKGQRTSITFGRDFNTKRLTVPLELVTGRLVEKDNPLLFVVDEFHRDGEDDGAQLNTKSLHITAKKSGEFVRVRVCVERADTEVAADTTAETQSAGRPGAMPSHARPRPRRSPSPAIVVGETTSAPATTELPGPHPGTYEGSITIIDGRVQTFTLPLTIKLAYPVWQNVAVLLWVVIVVGSFWVWSLKRDVDDTTISADSIRDFGRWLVTLNGAIAVVGGSAGAIGVFIATYMKSPDWGVDISQWLSLLAAMFTAFVAAASALAKKVQAGQGSAPAAPGQAPAPGAPAG